MLLYEDILTGDEMFSDAFPVKLVDDIVYEVDCAMTVIKEGEVDIGSLYLFETRFTSIVSSRRQPVRRGTG
jgi:hypothetical protein